VEKTGPDEDTTDVALDWLSGYREVPWALYLNFQATHFPYTLKEGAERPWRPDEPTKSTFGYLGYPEGERDVVINRYDNALRYVDEQLGRVVDYLQAAGELDDTLIIVTADHGEMFFEKGLVTHGKTLFEVEARVPIIMHWPAGIDPSRRDEPVSNLDILPTVADLLGFPAHPSWQGRSFLEPTGERRPIYMNIQGLRFADGIVCWPYKLILERTSKRQHLFDLSRDPDEQHDLIEDEPEIAARLADTLTKQLLAQLDYHREDALPLRQRRYQPRLRACPDLTGAHRGKR
jgi:arylsulfatase A-like enzyme